MKGPPARPLKTSGPGTASEGRVQGREGSAGEHRAVDRQFTARSRPVTTIGVEAGGREV